VSIGIKKASKAMALNLNNNRNEDMNVGLYAQMQQRINELEQKMSSMVAKPSAARAKAKPTEGGVKRGRMMKVCNGKQCKMVDASDDPDCCKPCGSGCDDMCDTCFGHMEHGDFKWPVGCTNDSDSESDDDDKPRKKKTKKAAKKARGGSKEADGICQTRGCDTKSRMFEGHCAAHRCSGGKC
jgi:hypothetical protein